jgi:hypothetical protein
MDQWMVTRRDGLELETHRGFYDSEAEAQAARPNNDYSVEPVTVVHYRLAMDSEEKP